MPTTIIENGKCTAYQFIQYPFRITVYPKPDISVRPHADLWNVTRRMKFEWSEPNILGKCKPRVMNVYNKGPVSNVEEMFRKFFEKHIRKGGSMDSWNDFYKYFVNNWDNARKEFIKNDTRNRFPFQMVIETKKVDAVVGAKDLTITKEIYFVDQSVLTKLYYPISVKIKVTYNINGRYNWRGASGYIPDISATSLVDLTFFENGYERSHGQATVHNENSKPETLLGDRFNNYSIITSAFNDVKKYVPAVSDDDVETILKDFRDSFWKGLAVVNKFAYHTESYERSDSSISFRTVFGEGGNIRFIVEKRDDVVKFIVGAWVSSKNKSYSKTYEGPTDDLHIYKLVKYERVKEVIAWYLETIEYPRESFLGKLNEIANSFFHQFNKEMPDMFKKTKENPFMEFHKSVQEDPDGKVVTYDASIKVEPSVEKINLNINLKKDEEKTGPNWTVEEVKELKASYEKYIFNEDYARADGCMSMAKDCIDHFDKDRLQEILDWLNDCAINNYDFKLRMTSYTKNRLVELEKPAEETLKKETIEQLDRFMNGWYRAQTTAAKEICISGIRNLIKQSNNSRSGRETFLDWMSKLDVNGDFFKIVENEYNLITFFFINGKRSSIVISDRAFELFHQLEKTIMNTDLRRAHYRLWKCLEEKEEMSLINFVHDICFHNPLENIATTKYFEDLIEDAKNKYMIRSIKKELKDEDWVAREFHEMDMRLKNMEGQVKGINKSCSKMHESFNQLKNEMVKLYHEKDGQLKLIEECLEKVERRLWPEMYEAYDKNPFAHWKLNVLLKRNEKGYDCTNCAEDGCNGGNCEHCCDCKDGSEFRPVK